MKYIPYIKYVIAPGTRFERDKEIFFGPDGKVSRGEPLRNYGWSYNGFKELIEAFYFAKNGNTQGFDRYYNSSIRGKRGDLLSRLREDKLVPTKLRGFIELRIKENMAIPVLYVEIERVYNMFCDECPIEFSRGGFPPALSGYLEKIGLLQDFRQKFQCTRQICKCLCDNYKDCIYSYTSTQGDPEVEREKEKCILDMLKQLTGESAGSSRFEHILKPCIRYDNIRSVISKQKRLKLCFERSLRFDFIPLRYFFFDPKTWSQMKTKRYTASRRKRVYNPNFDAIPFDLVSDFLHNEDFFDGTGLVAPKNQEGILESFLKVADVKFEIKYDLPPHNCDACSQTHRIMGIPIKAMFRDDPIFIHEARFADILWEKLWLHYPDEFCKSFKGKSVIHADESEILRREFKVGELCPTSRFSGHRYDYAICMSKLGVNRTLLFDLTTGLWRKSGFHEEARSPEEYLEIWKETLFEVPSRKKDVVTVWYIVINSTEEDFFQDAPPANSSNLNQLVANVSSGNLNSVKIIRTERDVSLLDPAVCKLVVVPIFKTTDNRRAAFTELQRLKNRRFEQLLITKVVDALLSSI